MGAKKGAYNDTSWPASRSITANAGPGAAAIIEPPGADQKPLDQRTSELRQKAAVPWIVGIILMVQVVGLLVLSGRVVRGLEEPSLTGGTSEMVAPRDG